MLFRSGHVPHPLGIERTGGDQQPDRHRQVEAGSGFGQPRRSQVDGDAVLGPTQPAREDRRPDPVAGLTAGRIGQADDTEGGKTTADVHLDGDGDAVDRHQDVADAQEQEKLGAT